MYAILKHEYLTLYTYRTVFNQSYLALPQDAESFSNFKEEDPSKCCWCCDVKVLGLKKSLCSGCLKARYCSWECLRANWAEHGEWCGRRQAERSGKEKKKKDEIRMEKIRRDIEEDDNVD